MIQFLLSGPPADELPLVGTQRDALFGEQSFRAQVGTEEFNAIGVMWSNQATDKMMFSYHRDGAADNA